MMARDTTTAVLLLSCQDQKGLVAATSEFIYRNDGNIVHADQHVDVEAGLFLQRVEWDLTGFRIPRAELADTFRPIAEKFGMQWELHFSDYVPRMAIFVSKLEHCLSDLLLRQRMGEFAAEIRLVVSNHPDLQQLVEAFGPQYHFYPITKETKAAQEKKEIELLEEQRIDLVVLARYMQIVSGEFVSRFRNRVINIHHSFLPAFPGGRPYHQAYERGVKIIGATSHYATEELDQGPIIEQDVVRVSHRDSVADMMRKGKDLEKVVLARAVSLHLGHRILVYGNKTVVFD
jgi:formyltetrahydrofolate deformylase